MAIPVVLVVGAVAWLLFFRGEKSIVHGIVGDSGPDMTVPEFHFKVRKTVAVPTEGDRDVKPSPQVKGAAKQVGEALSSLYTQAFLDPANWREGTYDDVWGMFQDGSAGPAKGDAEVLTLGAAGAGFEDIEPHNGEITAKVLTDDKGQPVAVVAVVKFSAAAQRSDGATTLIASQGQYFLEKAGSGWQVVSYDVNRADKVREPKPGPSGSASAEPSK